MNIVLTHNGKMTSMNEAASTPPILLIIDRLTMTSTSKDERGRYNKPNDYIYMYIGGPALLK